MYSRETMCRHRQKVPVSMSRREALGDTSLTDALTWDLLASLPVTQYIYVV